MDPRPLLQRLFYRLCRLLARTAAVVVFGIRCTGRHRMPADGGVLVCANHQSTLDPVLVGLTFNRPLNYLARETLFDSGWFGWLIRYLDAIPIDLDGGGSGTRGLREALRRIRNREMVLIFPEGTRTFDGELGPLRPGFCVLARRARAALLPIAIEGAFAAWPRGRLLPGPSRICVTVGEPIPAETVSRLDDAALQDEVNRRIGDCLQQARRTLAR